MTCNIQGVKEPMFLVSDSPGGIILSEPILTFSSLGPVLENGNCTFFTTHKGFFIKCKEFFNLVISNKGLTHLKVFSDSLNYEFNSELLKAHFPYTVFAYNNLNDSLGVFQTNHTAPNVCDTFSSVLSKEALEHPDCLTAGERALLYTVATLFVIGLIIIMIVILIVVLFFIKKFICLFKACMKRAHGTEGGQKVSRSLTRAYQRVKRLFSTANSGLSTRSIPIYTLFMFIAVAAACSSGGIFTGTVTNCDINGVCTLSASSSGVVNNLFDEVCLQALDGNNPVFMFSFRVVALFYDLTYNPVYYTGGRTAVPYSTSHCVGTTKCPDKCLHPDPDRTLDGQFTDPLINSTQGSLYCYNHDIDGFCFFPGLDCVWCGYYMLTQGSYTQVLRYQGHGLQKASLTYDCLMDDQRSEGELVVTQGVASQICPFPNTCFSITINNLSEYTLNPNVEYVTSPGYKVGSSDSFSLPGLPVVGKIGDLQSGTTSPWVSSDYLNFIYSSNIVSTSPSNSGCVTNVVTDPLINYNVALPKFIDLIYYTPITEEFSGVRAYLPNATSTLFTLTTDAGTTIQRRTQAVVFSIQSEPVFSGCCKCPYPATMTFTASMTGGYGIVYSDEVDFINPVFQSGSNTLEFLTDKCDFNDHTFTFSSNNYNLDYELTFTLLEADISLTQVIRYSTIYQHFSPVQISSEQDEDLGGFFKGMFDFSGGASNVFSIVLLVSTGLCLLIICIYLAVQIALFTCGAKLLFSKEE
jgi:hypothetical protein